MSLISFSPLQDGVTGVNAAATNTPLSTIYNDYNGNITDANIASGAAIAGSKLNIATVANPYKFSAYRSAALSIAGGSAFTKVTFDTKEYDTGTNFDIVTNVGRFTVPVTGFYRFNALVGILTAGSFVYSVNLYKNGSIFKTLFQTKTNAANTSTGNGVSVSAAASDYFEIYVFSADSGANNANVGQGSAWFCGEFISAT